MPAKVTGSKKTQKDKKTKAIKKDKRKKDESSDESSDGDDLGRYQNLAHNFATFQEIFGDQDYGDVDEYERKQNIEINKIEETL